MGTLFIEHASKRITYPVGDLCRCFTKLTAPSAYTLHSNLTSPQQMVQMAFCDLSHTFHKMGTTVSPACFCHPSVGNFDVSPYRIMWPGLMTGPGTSQWGVLTDCHMLLAVFKIKGAPCTRCAHFSGWVHRF